jgi:predicted RNA-binding Zn-ribbon protein involved in translation (DUF1610 family)
MKIKNLRKKKVKGETIYICPDCGGEMHRQDDTAEESKKPYSYRCSECKARATE